MDTCRETSLSYAIKTGTKGTSTVAKARLFKEVKKCRRLKYARVNEHPFKIAPRCYGLYETNVSYILVVEYVCESLFKFGSEFRDLNI